MAATDRDPQSVKEEFARRRRNQILLVAILFVGIVAVAALFAARHAGDPPRPLPIVLLLVLIAGSIAFSFINWRCPACGRHLPRGLFPRACRHCGAELS